MALPVIFVGPSLRVDRAAGDGLVLRPPARRGDLLAAAQAGAPVIGLIDGVFHQSLAVSPREVREAAACGARLFGGASMGALRAVDCPEAMTGIGEIYAAFMRGELTDDDEVAITFDPGDYRVLAYPLVQLREALRRVAAVLPSSRHALAAYLERVRALPFPERDRPRLRSLAEPLAAAGVTWTDLERWLDDEAADIKHRDARAVIEAVRLASA